MVWLETKRLILRSFEPQDAIAMTPILNNSEVMKFSPTGTLTVAQTREKITSFINLERITGCSKWAVIFQETGELIGYCGVSLEQIDDVDEWEIGYRLTPSFWGMGLATEAATAAIQYGFERLNLSYIMGVVERKNTASVKVLQKLRMKYQKEAMFEGLIMDLYRLNNL